MNFRQIIRLYLGKCLNTGCMKSVDQFLAHSTGLHACRYNRLFTVTGQCLKEDLPKFDAVIKTAVRSLKAELQPTL